MKKENDENKKTGKVGAVIALAMYAGGLAVSIPASMIAGKVTYSLGMKTLPFRGDKARHRASKLAAFGIESVVFDATMKSTTNAIGNVICYQETVNDATKRYLQAKDEKDRLMEKLEAQIKAEEEAKRHNVFEDAEKAEKAAAEKKEGENGEG
jgi:anti-sigma factor RsiW